MINIQGIQFHSNSREELLPCFSADFPYISTRAELNKYVQPFVPWHWHRTVEFFYMQNGTLEYNTPGGRHLFPEGSGGMVNSNVLHMTKPLSQPEKTIQLLHIFDTSLLAGEHGSRIEQKYIAPIVTSPQIEVVSFSPETSEHKKILELILEAFRLPEYKFNYEMKLRETLSELWLMLFEQVRPLLDQSKECRKSTDPIKKMMIYIHEHYSEKISISELAAAAYLSERECFRVFRDCLHMTPAEYIKSYRLQMACRMLTKGQEPVTVVGQACGLGSSSYFGKVFREYAHCTPSEYRRRWQDSHM